MTRTLTLLLVFFINASFAQFQFRISGEYGFPMQKDFVTNFDVGGDKHVEKGSYGNGIVLNLALGKGFNKNTSAYLDINYSTSREFTSYNYSSDGRVKFTRVSRGTYLGFAPTLLVKAAGKKVDPYVRFGVMAAFPSVREVREYTDDPEGENIYEYKGNIAIGTISAAGLEFSSGDGASLFFEVVSRNLVYHPKQLVNTRNYDGLPTEPTATFSKDPQGTEQGTVSMPFSSIGVCFGVRISIFSGPAMADY